MANTNGSGVGQHLTSIAVALIGAVSAIGGAWVMTQGQSTASSPPAAQVSNMAAQPDAGQSSVSASVAPVVQPPLVIVGAPAIDEMPQPLDGATTTEYQQPWPNPQGATALVVERIEVAREQVRVHLRFDNPASGPVTFYTATSVNTTTQGIQTYISERKGAAQGVTAQGGALFADPRAVEIAGGTQMRGWLEYTIGKSKKDAPSLYFTSQTTGYPRAGSHRIEYEPFAIPVLK